MSGDPDEADPYGGRSRSEGDLETYWGPGNLGGVSRSGVSGNVEQLKGVGGAERPEDKYMRLD